MLVVAEDIAFKHQRQVFARLKTLGGKEIGNTPIESLDHAIGFFWGGTDGDQLLSASQGGLQAVGGMRAVINSLAIAPFAYGG